MKDDSIHLSPCVYALIAFKSGDHNTKLGLGTTPSPKFLKTLQNNNYILREQRSIARWYVPEPDMAVLILVPKFQRFEKLGSQKWKLLSSFLR